LVLGSVGANNEVDDWANFGEFIFTTFGDVCSENDGFWNSNLPRIVHRSERKRSSRKLRVFRHS
jgi:hypothetical protein